MKPDARVFENLAAGVLLIVDSRETARAWRQSYDRAQRAAGRDLWRSARVSTLDDWLVQLWQAWRAEHHDARALMSDTQVVRAFEAIIAAESVAPLLNVHATARTAARSWRRLLDWRIDPGSLSAATAEGRSFRDWLERYRRQQAQHQWIDRAQLAGVLAGSPPRAVTGERVIVLGFEDQQPALTLLMQAFVRAGAQMEHGTAPRVESRVCRFAAADPDHELLAAAEWARARVASDASATCAIIVPDLKGRRASVRAVLERVLDPGSLLPTTPERLPLFAMIGGEPLMDFAIAKAALGVLALGDHVLSWSAAGSLLRSPYLPGWQEEAAARAQLDRRLRRLGQVQWERQALARLARDGACPLFAAMIDRVMVALDLGRSRRPMHEWVERLGATLKAAGWPEGRTLSSVEHQAARRFRDLLTDLALLGAMLPPVELRTVLHELERLCRDTAFQPDSGDPRIQVIDALQHPGPNYDGLWITGFTADRWPRGVEPDPFLPLELQRSLAMPGVSAKRELEEARRATADLLAAAGEVIISWPQQIEDSAAEPSPLLPPALADYEPAVRIADIAERAFLEQRIEIVRDTGPPFATPAGNLRGGAKVTELQAKCPFRAFGELRLEALALETPTAGIGRSVRGRVVHRAFERLWRELASHARLAASTPAQLEPLIGAAVHAACIENQLIEPRHLVSLERRWLGKVMQALLEIERQRAPFKVAALEAKERFAVGGAFLTLSIDRVDELESGGEIIIDYKTGRQDASHWLGPKRDLPQLPLYAVTRSAPPSGLAFARVNLREPGFSGMAADRGVGPGFREPREFRAIADKARGFVEQIEDWRRWVTSLVNDHIAGVARVDPVSDLTCRECSLAALCRVGSDVPVDERNDDAD